MSQSTYWNVPLVGPCSPTEMASRISNSFDALLSAHSGSSRPDYALAGTTWVDTSVTGKLSVKLYDGASDRILYTVDKTSGEISYSNPQLILKQSVAPTPTEEGDLR